MRSHGVYKPARVERVARSQRRRFLARSGLTVGELSGIQLGYLDSWARAQSKVELIDAYCAEHGLIREDGSPQPVMALYGTLLNSARHAMTRLEQSLQAQRPGRNALAEYLAENYGGDGEDS